jgi:hypothetical protein
MRRASRILALLVMAFPLAALALEKEYVAPPSGSSDDQPGWHGSLRVGANVNFTNNRKVVGQQEGNQFQIGGTFDGDIGYLRGEHDWRNSLGLLEAFTYGPPVRALMKTADTLRFDTAYLNYHLEQMQGNIAGLADKIGVERTHLYRKLKQLGIKPPKRQGS